jgi:hypothetical protein
MKRVFNSYDSRPKIGRQLNELVRGSYYLDQLKEKQVCPEMRMVRLGILALILLGFAPRAHADITVLLEEPYSYDGALAGTGHTAVYLSRVCADSPVLLRRCEPGERGVVISRYTRIAGYDWIAIPLIPYLYAVDKPEDVPLYADSKLVAFLRDQYRRSHLEGLAPDTPTGETPKGDWYELVGSSYDRTNYGFQIETTPEQDDAFIEWLNSRPNRASYRVVSRNCANFVRDVVNFYYPRAVSRGFITDLLVTTPKHDAKSFVKYTNHHPDILASRVVFPQVPGTIRRSKPVRGVLESVFRAKKYMVPLALVHPVFPIIAGGITSVYMVADRFNPGRNSMVFNMNGDPAVPVTNDERKTYLKNLEAVMAANGDKGASRDGTSWRQFEEKADIQMDESGHPVLQAPVGEQVVEMGITRDDIAGKDAPEELRRELLEARLRQQLARGRAPKISSDELHEDWRLLQEINSREQEEVSRGSDRRSQKAGGNSD